MKYNMNIVTPLGPTEASVSHNLISVISNNNIAIVQIYNIQATLASFNLYTACFKKNDPISNNYI